jgi:hypothetical protein
MPKATLAALMFGITALTALPAMAAPTVVDHVVLGAPDLAVGSMMVATVTGVTPVFGGVHPDRGTANALISLGARTYLEILAPAPGQEVTISYAKKVADLPGLNIQTFAVARSDLAGLAAAAKAAGLTVDGPIAGSRKTSDGAMLRWQMLNIGGHDFAGLVPFFIDWGDSRQPAAAAPAGATFTRLMAVSPDAAKLSAIYKALGLDIPVASGPKPLLLLEAAGKSGPIVLTGEPKGL